MDEGHKILVQLHYELSVFCQVQIHVHITATWSRTMRKITKKYSLLVS